MRILWLMRKQLDVALDRTVRLEMIRALRAAGHEVTFVTGYRHNRPDYGLGDAIRYLDSSSLPFVQHAVFSAAVRRELPKLVAELAPDAVVLDAWTVGPAAGWLARRQGGRPVTVVDVRTLPVGISGVKAVLSELLFRRGIQRASRTCDGVSVITSAMRDALVERYGLDSATPTAVWSSGVAAATFDPARFDEASRREVRAAAGIPDDAFVALYHGILSFERGLGELVSAMDTEDCSSAGVHLLLVGGGADTDRLKGHIASSASADRIHLVSSVANEDMPRIVHAADVGVLPLPDLPGWRVSSPIKLFEYLSMAVPVVLTPIEAHRAVVSEEAVAFWSAGSTAAQLGNAIGTAARLDATIRAQMGRRGRCIVLEGRTWAHQARALTEFLVSLGASS